MCTPGIWKFNNNIDKWEAKLDRGRRRTWEWRKKMPRSEWRSRKTGLCWSQGLKQTRCYEDIHCWIARQHCMSLCAYWLPIISKMRGDVSKDALCFALSGSSTHLFALHHRTAAADTIPPSPQVKMVASCFVEKDSDILKPSTVGGKQFFIFKL